MTTDEQRAAIDREMELFRRLAGAPRDVQLGCTRVSHDRLGYCTVCTPPQPKGELPLELLSWRLLALREALDD